MAEFKDYFTFSKRVHNLLFEGISVSSTEGIIGLCIGVAVFTFIFEVIKSLRHYLVLLQMKHKSYRSELSAGAEKVKKNGSLFTSLNQSSNALASKFRFHCLQTVLHMIQLAMGYMVMLIVMSYNAWLLITVIVTTSLCFYFHEYVLSSKSLIVPLEVPGSDL